MPENFDTLQQLAFLSVVGVLLFLERVHAWQAQPVQIATRWNSNITLFLVGGLIAEALLPFGLVAFARNRPAGPMETWGLPWTLQLLLTVLLLDLGRYWTHRLYHRIPLLWRIHLVHHSDTQVDATTSQRHHPLEMLLGWVLMLSLTAAFGLPAWGIGLYLLLAIAVEVLAHANLRYPSALDRYLNWLLVTPRVHRIHHSAWQPQTDSNYGAVLTVWDRLFGSYTDPGKARLDRFGLDYFRERAGGDLLQVLQQPFLHHAGVGTKPVNGSGSGTKRPDATLAATVSAVPTAAPAPNLAISAAWKLALQGSVAGCLLVLLALWPTALGLSATWMNSESYRYAWLVMPSLLYLLGWHYREQTLALVPQPGWAGLAVALLAAIAWGAAELINIDIGRQLALVLALQAVLMCALGWPVYRRLFPMLALLFLMVPCGDLLLPLLRRLTLESIVLFATLADLPYRVDGFVIRVVRHGYVIVDECAGLTYVTMGMFLGYSFGLMLYRSLFKAVALSAAAAGLAFLANAIRVNSIVVTDLARGTQMQLTDHAGFQSVGLWLTCVLLFVVLNRLTGDATPPAVVSALQSEPPAVASRWAPAVAGLLVLMMTTAVSQLAADPPASGNSIKPFESPQSLAGWELAAPPDSWSIDNQSRTASLRLSYRRGPHELKVVLVQTLAASAKLPPLAREAGEQGRWREKNAQQQQACDAIGCITVTHGSWLPKQRGDMRQSYSIFQLGGFSTTSDLALRAAHGWNRLTGHQDPLRSIGLIYDAPVPPSEEIALVLRTLQSVLSTATCCG